MQSRTRCHVQRSYFFGRRFRILTTPYRLYFSGRSDKSKSRADRRWLVLQKKQNIFMGARSSDLTDWIGGSQLFSGVVSAALCYVVCARFGKLLVVLQNRWRCCCIRARVQETRFFLHEGRYEIFDGRKFARRCYKKIPKFRTIFYSHSNQPYNNFFRKFLLGTSHFDTLFISPHPPPPTPLE